jgi:hypothetical protein
VFLANSVRGESFRNECSRFFRGGGDLLAELVIGVDRAEQLESMVGILIFCFSRL